MVIDRFFKFCNNLINLGIHMITSFWQQSQQQSQQQQQQQQQLGICVPKI